MMAQQAGNELLDSALAYASMGWYVLPVIRASKMPATRHGVRDASTDPRVIVHWFKDCEHNLAVAAGKSGFSVLDVDPRNGGDDTLAKLVQTHGPLPETAMQMTGGGGEHYLFRVPEGMRIRNNLGQGLDGLNEGKYFLVAPSIHASGKTYNWEGSSDPLEGQEIAEAPEWMLEHVPAQTEPAQVLQIKSTGFLPPERVADIRSALGSIPPDDYHTWIKIGQALHSTEAQEAFNIWDDWSKGSAKYNPGEMRKKWASFKPGGGLSVESIFVWAEQHGWVNPGKAGSYKPSRGRLLTESSELQNLIDRLQSPKRYQAVERPEPEFRPVPVQALQHLCHWINSQLDAYHCHATLACVLSLASVLAARDFKSTSLDPAHMYFMVISDSVGQTRKLKAIAQKFLSDIGHQKMIRERDFNTPNQIEDKLIRSPNVHFVADDYGRMIQKSRSQTSAYLQQTFNTIVTLYNQDEKYIDHDHPTNGKNDENIVVFSPSFVMLALVSEGQLPLIANIEELARGSLEQFVVVRAGQTIFNDQIERAPVPKTVLDVTAQLKPEMVKGEMSSVRGSTLRPMPKIAQIASDAGNVIHEYESGLRELVRETFRFRPLALGAVTSYRRLMVTLAAWDNPSSPRITVDIAQWAGWYVHQWLQTLLGDMELFFNDGVEADLYQKVLETFAKAGADGLQDRDIISKCKAYRALNNEKRSELLALMLKDEQIVIAEKEGKNGKIRAFYVYHAFAREIT